MKREKPSNPIIEEAIVNGVISKQNIALLPKQRRVRVLSAQPKTGKIFSLQYDRRPRPTPSIQPLRVSSRVQRGNLQSARNTKPPVLETCLSPNDFTFGNGSAIQQ